MEMNNEHANETLPFTLRRFHISEDYGFLLPNPLKELPPFYSPWMAIAHKLPHLIENHQLRSYVEKMPLLSTQHLQSHRELYLAHLVLSFITMGYVWQEGEKGTTKVLPRNLAVPFGEISQALGLPPILVHADFVLVNWKKKNPYGPLEIENLDPIVSLPGGDSMRGFILVTFLVEKAAAPGIKVVAGDLPLLQLEFTWRKWLLWQLYSMALKSFPSPNPSLLRLHPQNLQAMAQAMNGILQLNHRVLEEALWELANALKDMTRVLKKMHDYVDPAIFYGVIRIFLSGWKDNPALPRGLIYEGVWEEPVGYSGGSAAQSTTLHAFDELLGIQHSRESTAFLHSMREYMPPHHRAFVKEIQSAPPLRRHVLTSENKELRSAYNECVAALSDLRTYHITMVTKYISVAASNAKAKQGQATAGLSMSPPSFLEGKGTGGSGVLSFLKSVRDTTREALVSF